MKNKVVAKNSRKNSRIELILYTAGQSPVSIEAISNLKKISNHNTSNKFKIRIIDLIKNPDIATIDQIIALPTLIKTKPDPPVKIIGNLANHKAVEYMLGISNN